MPHLYLHVPFCARRCSYCDFSIAVRKRVPAAEYVDAVLRELDWLRAGVNRVSLGAQSFDDRVLRWMHRSHDAARIGDAVGMLRGAGIDNVSLDLIFALPVELGRDWARDLDQALALEPSHLSLYGLTVEQRTPLARWISRGAATAPDDERYAAEYLQAHVRLAPG